MSTVFSGLSALVIEDVREDGEVICVRARTRDRPVACPTSWRQSVRVAARLAGLALSRGLSRPALTDDPS